MTTARLDRIAVVVDDLDTATAQLSEVLGLQFVVLEVDAMGLRVAIGESGLELVEKTRDEVDIERVWRGEVASLEVRVDDIDAAVAAMNRIGYEVDHSLVTPGGVQKVQMGHAMGGLPTLLYHVPAGASYVEAVTGRSADQERYEAYTPTFDSPAAS